MSQPRKAVCHAVIYDPSTDSAAVPLLADEDGAEQERAPARPQLDDPIFSRFKISSLVLGLLVGFFIQFSTLGANFLVITIWGEETLSKSKRDIVIFSLLWSFFTSAMAIIILGFLRTLVSITWSVVVRKEQAEELLDDMILHMECRFVVGALVGVCAAWTLTDLMLGMRAQILYSLVTLCVALFWCRIMMLCFAASESKKHDIEQSGALLIV